MIGLTAAVFAAALAPLTTDAASIDAPTYESVGWSADGGAPVEIPGGVLYLFGDTVTPTTFTHNSAALVSYGVTVPLWHPNSLLPDTTDSWFWPADAVWTDGGLVVVANEVRRDASSWFGFEAFDTDLFVVRDPASVMSWQLATHVDAGPWDGLNVSFLDAERAVVRLFGDTTTYLADLTTPDWERTPIFDAPSDGTFVPVEHGGAWYGLTWSMATGEVALWSAAAINGDWLTVDAWTAAADSYGHQLHDVDGQIVYVHFVPGNGYKLGASTAFPVYQDVTDRLEA